MTESHYNTYVNNFATQIDLLDFLIEILMLFQDLVGKDGVYTSDWREMTLLQNRYFHNVGSALLFAV